MFITTQIQMTCQMIGIPTVRSVGKVEIRKFVGLSQSPNTDLQTWKVHYMVNLLHIDWLVNAE